MIFSLAYRFFKGVSPRVAWKFFYNFGWKGMRAVLSFKKRMKKGQYFPAFLMLSLTDQCNLRCQGCWVSQQNPSRKLSPEVLDQIISSANKQKSYFFGILGGEPILYPNLFQILSRYSQCYFQLFTNGTLLTPENTKIMKQLGNITPLISIEGIGETSDVRRGGHQVYERALQGLEYCRQQGLIVGVATSVCQSNFDQVVRREFLKEMIQRGVHYVWYYIYRPVGPHPSPELILSQEQIITLRKFLVSVRTELPVIIVDAYWDHLGQALCPGAVGLSNHIGPDGDVEFCPPLQFAQEKITAETDLAALFENSQFLTDLRKFCQSHTSGCVLLDCPQDLVQFIQQHQVYDSSGRNTALAEISSMKKCPGHHISDCEIPEKHWLYRWAKRYGFFGFGGYG